MNIAHHGRQTINTKPFFKAHVALLLSVLVLVDISGCGFRLRGSVALPEELRALSVESKIKAPELKQLLQDTLKLSGVNIGDNAPFVIVLENEQFSRRITTVDANARASEYEIREQLYYSLKNKTGDTLLSNQSVDVIRSYSFELDQISGKQKEEQILRREMRKEAIIKMVRQLKFVDIASLTATDHTPIN